VHNYFAGGVLAHNKTAACNSCVGGEP
jgi:hypothetical protein